MDRKNAENPTTVLHLSQHQRDHVEQHNTLDSLLWEVSNARRKRKVLVRPSSSDSLCLVLGKFQGPQ